MRLGTVVFVIAALLLFGVQVALPFVCLRWRHTNMYERLISLLTMQVLLFGGYTRDLTSLTDQVGHAMGSLLSLVPAIAYK